ncbi:hypothetical protein [Cryobacterium luteum]|uniref:Uncharacterized protein n=1 Tax=Cryobacterium luteum TaxID=1424661 RepID=A0A1H8HI27_9MICO|nr:hypothetical protein [Cryobacterium luteum]TFB86665.1 hypothetical protein E3O10_13670 [Cryobacterium luteum]SEN55627.1 hypothetical protein SAMN05216281_109117 [Cryobacterium luteum]
MPQRTSGHGPLAPTRFVQRCAGLLLLVTLGALTLSACAFLRGGQSADSAAARIDKLPAVASSEVTQSESLDGFTRSWFTYVTVTLDSDYRVGDAQNALEWGLRTGWSVNDHEPTAVSVSFIDSAGDAVDWDWEAATAGLGLESASNAQSMSTIGLLMFSSAVIGDSLGDWPGDVPELAGGVFVRG